MEGISFGTDGWRALRSSFTEERVRAVAQAIADTVDDGGTIAVGYDAREGARHMATECCRVLAAAGHDVVLSDRDCPTPSIAYTIVDRELDGGIMLTASHNPPEYLGIKFIPEDGAPALPAVTDRIEANLRPPEPLPDDDHGRVREVDVRSPHIQACLDRVDPALDGLTVAYDAIHGSGRGVTDEALERAGATVRRLRCDRDPEFDGGGPDPSPERLGRLMDLVQSGEADLGVANDGDADRLTVVTPEGHLDANRTLAVLYEYLLETEAGGPIVRSISTTNLLDRIAGAHDYDAYETPVGFKWVAEAMADHDALLGGEESGGLTVRDHVREKDGVLGAVLVAAAAAGRSIDERRDAIIEEYGDIVQDRRSVDCPDDHKTAVVEGVRDDVPDAVRGVEVTDVNDADGAKLLLADGSWLLVRASGTEPKLRIYAEAGDADRVADLLDAGEELIDAVR